MCEDSPLSSSDVLALESGSSDPDIRSLFWLLMTVPSKRSRRLTVTPLAKAELSVGANSSKSNLVRNPRLPSAKLSTGGTMRWKSQLA